jgi:hypothetical protein
MTEKMCGPEGWVYHNPPVRCDVCDDLVDKTLKVKKTGALLCSLACEGVFWLDIFY